MKLANCIVTCIFLLLPDGITSKCISIIEWCGKHWNVLLLRKQWCNLRNRLVSVWPPDTPPKPDFSISPRPMKQNHATFRKGLFVFITSLEWFLNITFFGKQIELSTSITFWSSSLENWMELSSLNCNLTNDAPLSVFDGFKEITSSRTIVFTGSKCRFFGSTWYSSILAFPRAFSSKKLAT